MTTAPTLFDAAPAPQEQSPAPTPHPEPQRASDGLLGASQGKPQASSRSGGSDRARGAVPVTTRSVEQPDPARPDEAIPNRPGRVSRAVTAAAVLVVAVTAAVTSFSHQHTLALAAGETETAALLLPLSVDGLTLAASLVLLDARRSGRAAGALPWLALGLGVLASLTANVAAAEPTITGRVVAAWPPVALALSFELLLRQVERGSPPSGRPRTVPESGV